MRLVLASSSPRRKELLSSLYADFDVCISYFDEHSISHEYFRLPYELSRFKAYEVFNKRQNDIVIASDTIVALEDQVFNKPINKDDAERMLSELSGKMHRVLTSYTIISKNREISRTIIAKVFFRKISLKEIKKYIDTDIPYDKAGAYGIQEDRFNFVEHIDGDMETVMGFPIHDIKKDLRKFGLKV